MLRQLAALADHLDRIGLTKEADFVDALLKEAAKTIEEWRAERMKANPALKFIHEKSPPTPDLPGYNLEGEKPTASTTPEFEPARKETFTFPTQQPPAHPQIPAYWYPARKALWSAFMEVIQQFELFRSKALETEGVDSWLVVAATQMRDLVTHHFLGGENFFGKLGKYHNVDYKYKWTKTFQSPIQKDLQKMMSGVGNRDLKTILDNIKAKMLGSVTRAVEMFPPPADEEEEEE